MHKNIPNKENMEMQHPYTVDDVGNELAFSKHDFRLSLLKYFVDRLYKNRLKHCTTGCSKLRYFISNRCNQRLCITNPKRAFKVVTSHTFTKLLILDKIVIPKILFKLQRLKLD